MEHNLTAEGNADLSVKSGRSKFSDDKLDNSLHGGPATRQNSVVNATPKPYEARKSSTRK